MDELFDKAWTHIAVTRREAVCEVALARPEARNALNGVLMEELTEVARLLRLRTDILAVILTGTESYFSAGADLSASQARAGQATLMEARRAVMAGPDMCKAWDEIEAVTIAAVEGYCIGGASALAVSCDFRVMGEGAYMRLPEVPLGMNMSWRTLPKLVALAGPSRAKQYVMFGEACDAQRCLAWGFADEVVETGGALAAARRWAAKTVALPPLPVRATKEAVNAIAQATAQASIYMDRDQYLLMSRSADYREGIAAFREKRPGMFTGD
ncbi:enoyl-CoA hydratase/isomerase family protein [Phenylobacterium sp.]|uniref:enoyl-CoA hydratase/isomerase family protein n=1 Tax=Phenylobacterium sp. TaxID=1871053 RepID=UPI002BCA6715|nr:enoyl-CoA hydratase/isomerase family protein [Phenylobacterium sp.]HLZ73602.1 enoyl-CoA hydratase/isomerase family protein [Phenylobacterium sp.]